MHTEEKLLLGLIIGTAVVMLATSMEYSPEARIFPQVAAVVTILFGIAAVLQSRLDVGTADGTDLLSRVQDSAALGDDPAGSTAEDGDEAGVTISKAPPGEFRIDQPTMDFRIPFTERHLPLRVVVSVLLIVYLGVLWLFGIFVSSIVFVLLYGGAVRLRRTVFATLVVFVVLTMVLFGMWLETPLFRPAHDLFALPEVDL
jgi:hypothetical protein